jgi:G3E family GTPase
MTASIITPVTLLTGFLGSGKTTLLNRILQSPLAKDTAVLINEFGEVPIDHLLVRESSEQITVLANGCICCSVAGDMVKALRDLYFKRANGEVPFFKRVVIETTGLANPAPIMHTLIEMPLITTRYTLSGVVTTVDATHGMHQLDTQAESVKQTAVADRIVVTKTDTASTEVVQTLVARLKTLNPGATVLLSERGNVDPARLFDTGLYQPERKTMDVQGWLNAEAYRQLQPPTTSLTHALQTRAQRAFQEAHDSRIRAFCVRIEQAIVWEELINAIEMIQAMRGDHLLRLKGIVNVAGENTPRAIHAVEHTIYPFAKIPSWPGDDHATQLVFIVRDLDETFIRDTIAAYVLPTETKTQNHALV